MVSLLTSGGSARKAAGSGAVLAQLELCLGLSGLWVLPPPGSLRASLSPVPFHVAFPLGVSSKMA